MQVPSRRCIRSTVLILLITGLAAAFPVPAQSPTKPKLAEVDPAEPGGVFPAHTFNNLNAGVSGPDRIDLGKVIGKQAIILSYWIPRNKRAEEMILGLQDLLSGRTESRAELYAVVNTDTGLDPAKVRERAEKIGLKMPILQDEGFRLGQQLVVQMVPHLSILDAEGKLQLVNGGSLLQDLEYKFTVKDAVARVAETGKCGLYGYLPKYYPAVELVGEPCPEFQAPSIQDGVMHGLSGLVDQKRLNILVFWSIDCPHCRKQIPEINRWFQKRGKGVNITGMVKVLNETQKIQTREFLELNGIQWLTVEDQDRKIAREYQVTSTPTIFIVRPDGIIDSVLVSGYVNFVSKFEEAKRQYLAATGGS
jgi:peroxiredoxin